MSEDQDTLPDDHEPPEHERVYYRHNTTGQLAYVVRVDGQDELRYDQGPESPLAPSAARGGLDLGSFTVDSNPRPILESHAAMIAFEADKAVCHVLGKYQLSRREWTGMSDKARLTFMSDGPQTQDRLRRDIWVAITDVARKHAHK